jgi:hypothetical protein
MICFMLQLCMQETARFVPAYRNRCLQVAHTLIAFVGLLALPIPAAVCVQGPENRRVVNTANPCRSGFT